jgi:hypothetical protein
MRKFAFIFLVSLWMSIAVMDVSGQRKEILSSICPLSVPSDILQNNVSFVNSYKFKINENDEIVEVKPLYEKFDALDQVVSCLKKWKISGFSNGQTFSVYFSFEHSVGWTKVRVKTKNFLQITTLNQEDL